MIKINSAFYCFAISNNMHVGITHIVEVSYCYGLGIIGTLAPVRVATASPGTLSFGTQPSRSFAVVQKVRPFVTEPIFFVSSRNRQTDML